MLEDYIAINKVDAEIISFPTETNVESAIKKKGFSSNSVLQIKLYNTVNNNPFLVMAPFYSKINEKKLCALLSEEEIIECNADEVFNITGYEKGFLPPISIYGIKVIADESIKEKKNVFCPINEKQFLKVLVQAIIDTDEEIVFEDIIE